MAIEEIGGAIEENEGTTHRGGDVSGMPDTVTVADGRKVAYAEWGDPSGTPMFLLHGTPGCRLNRPARAGLLGTSGLRLVTYDRPGYGASDRHRGRCVADCASDVAAVADALGIGRFAVAGGSGGGPHALAVGAGLGDRVTAVLCMVGLAPYPADGLDWTEGMDPENVKEFGWVLEGEDRLTVELEGEAANMRARVAEDPARLLEGFELPEADLAIMRDDEVQSMWRASTEEMFANGVFGWVDDDLAFVTPWGFDVTDIAVPVEVRFGAQDVLVPASHGYWLAEHVPGATKAVETGQGHLGHPEEMIGHLRRVALAC